MKVKVKMPLSYYVSITDFLSDLDESSFVVYKNNFITQQVLTQSLRELNKKLLYARYKNSFDGTPKNKVSVTIEASYALNFFGLFYGNDFDGHARMSINEMCRQLEQQLFKSGSFKLPSYGN